MSLINKYRPSNFEGVAGNQITIGKIKALLDKNDPKRTFLLSGPMGCGKTTIGRVIAKYVGCDTDFDFIEVDAAALNGVAPARELRNTCHYRSLTQGPRVWLIDECHRMTKPAQEILLKTFEEPPSHAFFILATTEPQALEKTVVDRFSHFKVAPLTEEEFKSFIKKIARREKIEVPEEVIELLFDKSEGRPRSALNMLEKIATSPVDEMLSMIKDEQEAESEVIELCRLLIKKASWNDVRKVLKSVMDKEDPETIRRIVLGYMTSILLKSDNNEAFEIASNFMSPFYTNGKSDLVFYCYQALS